MRDELAGRAVTVMGLGRFGGGAGVTRWLAQRGAIVTVTDLADEASLAPAIAPIRDLVERGAVRVRLGGHDEIDFTRAALVVANPAVPQPWQNPYLRAAAAAGVPVTTEIRLVAERLSRRRVIGVTGTAGKSTTAAMIHHALVRCAARAHLGGNIGGSLLGALESIVPDDLVVLELSSAMLHWLGAGVGAPGAAGFSPGTAVLTNLHPNHLDWHGSFEHYAASKENVFRWQVGGDAALRGGEIAARGAADDVELVIPGEHNRRNALVAAAAVERAAGIARARALAALADFPGLPHRLRLVAQDAEGRRFYDDSKSTVPGATVLAVRAFARPDAVHLIAGGYDKGIDLSPIVDVARDVAGLYAIGATGPRLAAPLRSEACDDLEVAVRRAMDRMKPGDVLLLSPGCASWDQFDNYEERGRAFAAAVESVQKGRAP
jgi:UDP-N-acetylmuramoylalanine--D-glutamate ligase